MKGGIRCGWVRSKPVLQLKGQKFRIKIQLESFFYYYYYYYCFVVLLSDLLLLYRLGMRLKITWKKCWAQLLTGVKQMFVWRGTSVLALKVQNPKVKSENNSLQHV